MCTATTYKTDCFYMGRTLDYEFSYGERITITPRNYPFHFRHDRDLDSHYAMIGMAYVVNDFQTIEDPLFNENIMMNPVLRQNLQKVVNRTEFRVLDCDSKLKYEIAQHNSKVDFMCSVKTSAQGGPQLLPNLRLEEEFFVVKDKDGNVVRESASVLHKTARTLIGIKNLDNSAQEAHIFIVTNEHPMDIFEARDLCASYDLDSAMAFDGGSSTSLNYKNISVVSTQTTGDTGRALKSFMVVKQK